MDNAEKVLTIRIEFPSDLLAREFCRRYHKLIKSPSLRDGAQVYIVLVKADFEGAVSLAAEHSGVILYGGEE